MKNNTFNNFIYKKTSTLNFQIWFSTFIINSIRVWKLWVKKIKKLYKHYNIFHFPRFLIIDWRPLETHLFFIHFVSSTTISFEFFYIFNIFIYISIHIVFPFSAACLPSSALLLVFSFFLIASHAFGLLLWHVFDTSGSQQCKTCVMK